MGATPSAMSTYDPMARFDARTAYARDFRFAPGVIEASHVRDGDAKTYKVWMREIMRSHADYPSAAEALGVISVDGIWELWRDDLDNPPPAAGHRLTLNERPVTPVMIVGGTSQSHYNRWMVKTTEGVADG